MKPFFYIGVGFIVMILFFQSMTTEYNNHFTVSLADEKTKKAIPVEKVSVYPGLPLYGDEVAAGKGSHIFRMGHSTLVLIVAKSKGYKNEYKVAWIKPNIKVKMKMTKKESKDKTKKEKKEQSKDKGNKTKTQSGEERKELNFDLIKIK